MSKVVVQALAAQVMSNWKRAIEAMVAPQGGEFKVATAMVASGSSGDDAEDRDAADGDELEIPEPPEAVTEEAEGTGGEEEGAGVKQQQAQSSITFTAPADLTMVAGETLEVRAGGYATDDTFTITCADATSISTQFSSVSRTANTCNYSVVAKATAAAGSASFTVPYTSSGGDTYDGVISVSILVPLTALSPRSCANGTFVDLTANPRVPGRNNDLVEDCRVLVRAQNHWAAVSANNTLPTNHALRTWGTGATQKINTWAGVDVRTRRLNDLSLIGSAGSKISGTIPAGLGDLSNLWQLDLSDNQLAGTIPHQLGHLSNLNHLKLYGNQLAGGIPAELGRLTNLRTLRLEDNQLIGSIPTQLGSLINLTTALRLDDNLLTGSIPTQLGSLTSLINLYLNNNQLTGSIPTQLGSLTSLVKLQLSNNRLTGSIPTQLGNLSSIGGIHLNDNRLTGTLDASLASPTGLILYICQNYLTGAVPQALRSKLGAYSTAQIYDPVACQRSSSLAFTAPTGLRVPAGRSITVDASLYAFYGSSTLACADATGVTASKISITRTGCSYTITAQATATGTASFTVPYTAASQMLNGTFTVTIGTVSNIVFTSPPDQILARQASLVFDAFQYVADGNYAISCGDATGIDSKITVQRSLCRYTITAGNQLGVASFTVPYTSSGGDTHQAQISVLLSLAIAPLSLDDCNDGTFVDLTANPRVPGRNNDLVEDCRVLVRTQNDWAAVPINNTLPTNHALRTWGTGATQKINTWAGVDVRVRRLNDLSLAGSTGSKISGTIPTGLGNLSNLWRLNLSGNQLTGTIPHQLGKIATLNFLLLHSNQLSGIIPKQLDQLTSLTSLRFDSNQLTGGIPTELGSLTDLTLLRLDNNLLTGSIPTQLGSLTKLINLYLNNNQLTGSIPTQLGSLTSLVKLELSNNRLTGSIPTQLGNLSSIGGIHLNDNRLTGTLDASLASPASLILYICQNYLTGAVPQALRSKLGNYALADGFNPIACQRSSSLAFTAPTGLQVPAGRSITVDASLYAFYGSSTLTCADATGVTASKISVTRTGCSYTIAAQATATGTASFTVPYTAASQTLNGTFTVAIGTASNIVFTSPVGLIVATSASITVYAADYATDGNYAISCADATGIDSKITVQRTLCRYTVTAGTQLGRASFTVPYTSAGGNTYNGTINIAIGPESRILFTAPTGLKVARNFTLAIDASRYVTEQNSVFTISCLDATGVDTTRLTAVSRSTSGNGCTYTIDPIDTLSPSLQGDTTFTITYLSTSGRIGRRTIRVNIGPDSNLTFTAPGTFTVGRNRTLEIDALAAISGENAAYTVSCGDATGVDATKMEVAHIGSSCSFTVDPVDSLAVGSQGDTTFSVAYTSTGGATASGTFTVNIGPDSTISYTSPGTLTVGRNRTLEIDVSSYVSDGSYTIACADATGVDTTKLTSVSRSADTCTFTIDPVDALAQANQGDTTFLCGVYL